MQNSANLQKAFQHLSAMAYQGVEGVDVWESGHKGPTVGITVMTHGNEPAGLLAYQYFLENPIQLKTGRIVWVLNNLAAAKNYILLPLHTSLEDKIKTRQVDMNMNRLPFDVWGQSSNAYEIKRAQSLRPIWSLFDYALDIHSTSQDAEAMLVVDKEDTPSQVYHGFPTPILITNIGAVMRDRLAMTFYGHDTSHNMLVEVGQHECSESVEKAIQSIRALLMNTGIVEGSETVNGHSSHRFAVYALRKGIFFPSADYKTVKIFPNFELVKKGELMATGDGDPLYFDQDGHALMCFATGRPPDHTAEEALFVSDPVTYIG